MQIIKFLIEELNMDINHKTDDGKNMFLLAAQSQSSTVGHSNPRFGQLKLLQYLYNLDGWDCDLKTCRDKNNDTAFPSMTNCNKFYNKYVVLWSKHNDLWFTKTCCRKYFGSMT